MVELWLCLQNVVYTLGSWFREQCASTQQVEEAPRRNNRARRGRLVSTALAFPSSSYTNDELTVL